MPSRNVDHLTIPVPEEHFEPLVEWYKKALSPLGYKEIMRFPGIVGLGNEFPDFWIAQKEIQIPSGFHFAFSAPNQAAVDAFHKAAIDAGGTCNGKPGLRPEYHEHYYAAYVLDLIGNNMEMVTHCPEGLEK
ncbi:Glyoxalase/Bleomycin resistance protein/Dihydroxybiphenyl dioxygenase [Aspergillus bertholletiae]|uniref:Glyoxalase/Bleomycin resistance protein/Dihydroxybiphenyl dioxygenase n=1 Tax=Aspergillus bertholletiae TaxID=1226010 RepID=A0A5N7BAN2_9EURO|nr:Glyoxalase/Bleomycin resistance protein/Dihydroxybiphenyl dioxygenase [Aspergillus bertholletiae]